MVDKTDIKNLLLELGLDEVEAQIYKILLYKGKKSILNLSREINLPRSTVYRICENMVLRNLLEWTVKYKSKEIKAVSPKDLENYLIPFKQKYEKMNLALNNLIKVSTNLNLNPLETEVRYYKGIDGMKQLIWNTLQAKDTIFGYTPWGRDLFTGTKFENRYASEAKKRNIQDMVITNKRGVTLYKKFLKGKIDCIQRVRIANMYITSDVYIYNNVYAVNTWMKGEISGVEIENEEICKLQKGIFKNMWKSAIPLERFIEKKDYYYRFVYDKDREIRV